MVRVFLDRYPEMNELKNTEYLCDENLLSLLGHKHSTQTETAVDKPQTTVEQSEGSEPEWLTVSTSRLLKGGAKSSVLFQPCVTDQVIFAWWAVTRWGSSHGPRVESSVDDLLLMPNAP